MKTVIRYRNVAKLSRPDLHQMIERLAERVLARICRTFRPNCSVCTQPWTGAANMVSIAFVCRSLSGATLACAEESSRLEKAIEHAFTELDRQVERHVAHLRHEDAWRRKERRVGLRQLKTALNEESDAETASFSSLVRPLLASLHRFVQRELSTCRREANSTRVSHPSTRSSMRRWPVRVSSRQRAHVSSTRCSGCTK